jgi:hypothetical protein
MVKKRVTAISYANDCSAIAMKTNKREDHEKAAIAHYEVFCDSKSEKNREHHHALYKAHCTLKNIKDINKAIKFLQEKFS